MLKLLKKFICSIAGHDYHYRMERIMYGVIDFHFDCKRCEAKAIGTWRTMDVQQADEAEWMVNGTKVN